MSSPRLTETSYIVLGLLERAGSATPYDLERFARISVFNFWRVPHTQLYSECARLAEAGRLRERREENGRRRRFYTLAAQGRNELAFWRSEPTEQLHETRDPGTLKLFFGGDAAVLASAQLTAHKRKLGELEQADRDNPEIPDGMRLALDAGIGHEREFIRFGRNSATRKGTEAICAASAFPIGSDERRDAVPIVKRDEIFLKSHRASARASKYSSLRPGERGPRRSEKKPDGWIWHRAAAAELLRPTGLE